MQKTLHIGFIVFLIYGPDKWNQYQLQIKSITSIEAVRNTVTSTVPWIIQHHVCKSVIVKCTANKHGYTRLPLRPAAALLTTSLIDPILLHSSLITVFGWNHVTTNTEEPCKQFTSWPSQVQNRQVVLFGFSRNNIAQNISLAYMQ